MQPIYSVTVTMLRVICIILYVIFYVTLCVTLMNYNKIKND